MLNPQGFFAHYASGGDTRPNVMEQILLRVTGARAEMCGRKPVQALHADSPPGKVKLLERPHHPNIDREGRLEPVSEEQDTIGDLPPHARQGQQLIAR